MLLNKRGTGKKRMFILALKKEKKKNINRCLESLLHASGRSWSPLVSPQWPWLHLG